MRWLPAVVVCLPCVAWPCGIVDPGALHTHVRQEEALIVFDERKGLEHFIRGAEFVSDGDGDSFGFIVPTPSVPEFGEFDPTAFERLASAYEAARPEELRLQLRSLFVLTARADGAVGSVEVLRTDRVAGMDVTVVTADDGRALAQWLAEHGFATRPALQEWLDSYVKQGWVFSAFKYSSAPHARVTSQALRITFATKTPVYPYREPADSERFGGLRLWVVAPQARAWAGHAPFMRSAKLQLPSSIEALLPGPKVVTLFEDATVKRPDADPEFIVSAASDELLSPRRVPITLPLEGLCCLFPVALGAGFFLRRRRRV